MTDAEKYFEKLHNHSMNIKIRYLKYPNNFKKLKKIKDDFRLSKDEYEIITGSYIPSNKKNITIKRHDR